jgi:hypothetical protein
MKNHWLNENEQVMEWVDGRRLPNAKAVIPGSCESFAPFDDQITDIMEKFDFIKAYVTANPQGTLLEFKRDAERVLWQTATFWLQEKKDIVTYSGLFAVVVTDGYLTLQCVVGQYECKWAFVKS